MFRTSWETVSYASKARARQQQPPRRGSVAGAGGQVSGGGGPRQGGGVGGPRQGGGVLGQGAGGQDPPQRRTDYVENGQQTREVNILSRDLRVANASREKFLFNQRIKMEERRSRLAKGNILTFLMDRKSVDNKRVLLNKVLRIVGFKASDFLGVKLNDYRDSQAEVLLKDEVIWDLDTIEKKLKEAGLNVSVSRFDDKEEVINIFGLPMTNDISGMKEKIREAIEPFVGRVKDILATVYNGNGNGSGSGEGDEDVFGGLHDGNYRVKVTPLKDASMQVPNFVVIDKDTKVCAKAVYSKAINEKKNMCTNCYATDHFRDNALCQGSKTWETYAEEFELTWREALAKKSDEMEMENDNSDTQESEGRHMQLVRELKEKMSQQDEKLSSLEAELEEYKKVSEGGNLKGMDVDGEDGEDDGEKDDGDVGLSETSISSEIFVDTHDAVSSVNAVSQESGAVETVPVLTDPLRINDWSKEVDDIEKSNGIKRKEVSPISGGVVKKGSTEEMRRKFASYDFQVGSRYEFKSGGMKHIGTFLKADFPHMRFRLDNRREVEYNVVSDFTKIRLAPKSSF